MNKTPHVNLTVSSTSIILHQNVDRRYRSDQIRTGPRLFGACNRTLCLVTCIAARNKAHSLIDKNPHHHHAVRTLCAPTTRLKIATRRAALKISELTRSSCLGRCTSWRWVKQGQMPAHSSGLCYSQHQLPAAGFLIFAISHPNC